MTTPNAERDAIRTLCRDALLRLAAVDQGDTEAVDFIIERLAKSVTVLDAQDVTALSPGVGEVTRADLFDCLNRCAQANSGWPLHFDTIADTILSILPKTAAQDVRGMVDRNADQERLDIIRRWSVQANDIQMSAISLEHEARCHVSELLMMLDRALKSPRTTAAEGVTFPQLVVGLAGVLTDVPPHRIDQAAKEVWLLYNAKYDTLGESGLQEGVTALAGDGDPGELFRWHVRKTDIRDEVTATLAQRHRRKTDPVIVQAGTGAITRPSNTAPTESVAAAGRSEVKP